MDETPQSGDVDDTKDPESGAASPSRGYETVASQMPQGVLLGVEIQRLTAEANLLVGADAEQFGPASYDLRLGNEYYQDGGFRTLSDEQDTIVMKANDFVFVSTLETLQMPRDLTGRCYLRRTLANKGAGLLSQGQIDPGFTGRIFGLLYNFAQGDVYLRRGDHVFTVEFTYTTEWREGAWDYPSQGGEYQNSFSLRDFLRKHDGPPLQGGWRAIEAKFDALEGQLQAALERTQDLATQGFRLFTFALAALGVLAVLFAAAGVYIVIKSPSAPNVVVVTPSNTGANAIPSSPSAPPQSTPTAAPLDSSGGTAPAASQQAPQGAVSVSDASRRQ